MKPEEFLAGLARRVGAASGDCLTDEQIASAAGSLNSTSEAGRAHLETCDACFGALSAALDAVDLLADRTASIYATVNSVTVAWGEHEETIALGLPIRQTQRVLVAAEGPKPYGKPQRIEIELGAAKLTCAFSPADGEVNMSATCQRRPVTLVIRENGGPLLARLQLKPRETAELRLPLDTPLSLTASL